MSEPTDEKEVAFEDSLYCQVESQIRGMFPEHCELGPCGDVQSYADALACDVENGRMTLAGALEEARKTVEEFRAECPLGPRDGKCGKEFVKLAGVSD